MNNLPFKTSRAAFAFLLAGMAGVTGCMNLKQPAKPELSSVKTPGEWKSDATVGAVQDNWLASFGDTQLVSLVSEALANNPDLGATAARLEQAMANSKSAQSALWPTLDANAGAQNTTRFDRSSAQKAAGVKVNSTSYGASLDLSWEIDVWGRLRYARRSASESAAASAGDYTAARRSLAAQVAKAWFAAAEGQLQLQLSTNVLATYEETLRIVDVRFKAGAVSAQDVANAKADLATARRQASSTETTFKESVRSLEVLLGRYPAAELDVLDDLQAVKDSVPAGLPSELLERRADVIAAERRVAAAFNTTEEKRAARLPRLALTSSLGASSTELKNLVDPKNAALTLAGNLFAPIFDGGARKADLERAKAEQKEAAENYRGIALNAFQEVENLLSSGSSLAHQEEQAREAVQRYEEARHIAETRYKSGTINLTDVLVIQRQEFQAKSTLLSLRNERLAQRVNLHLALGGDFASGNTTIASR